MLSVSESGLLHINNGLVQIKEIIASLRQAVQVLNDGGTFDLSPLMAKIEDRSLLADNRITRELLRILLLTDVASYRQIIIDYILHHHIHIDLDLSILVLLPLWSPGRRDILLNFLSAVTGSQQELAFLAITDLLSYQAFRNFGYNSSYFLLRAVHAINQNTVTVNLIETSLLFHFANIAEQESDLGARFKAFSKRSTAPSFITLPPLFWQMVELALYRVLELSVPELGDLSASYANSSYMPVFSLSYLTIQPVESLASSRGDGKAQAKTQTGPPSALPLLQITGTKTVISWADYISFWDPFLFGQGENTMDMIIHILSLLVTLNYRLITHPHLYPDLVSTKQAERSIFFSLELLMIMASVGNRVFSLLSTTQPSPGSKNSAKCTHIHVLSALKQLFSGFVTIARTFPRGVPEAFTDCYNSVLVTIFRTTVDYLQWDMHYTNVHVAGISGVYIDCVRTLIELFATFSPSLHIKALKQVTSLIEGLLRTLPKAMHAAPNLKEAVVTFYLLLFKYYFKTYSLENLESVLASLIGLTPESFITILNVQFISNDAPQYEMVGEALLQTVFPLDHGMFGQVLAMLLKLHKHDQPSSLSSSLNLHYLTLSMLSYFNYGGTCLQVASFHDTLHSLFNLCSSSAVCTSSPYLARLRDSIQAVLYPGTYVVAARCERESPERDDCAAPVEAGSEWDGPIARYASEVIDDLIKRKMCSFTKFSKKEVQARTSTLLTEVYGPEKLPPRDSLHVFRLYVAAQIKSKTDYPFLWPRLSRAALYVIAKSSVQHPELILLCFQWNYIRNYAMWYSERAASIAVLGYEMCAGSDRKEICELLSTSGQDIHMSSLNLGTLRLTKITYSLALEHPSIFRYPVGQLFLSLLRTAVLSPSLISFHELLVYRTLNSTLEPVGSEILRLLMRGGLPIDALLSYCMSHFRDSPMLIAFSLIAAIYSLQISPRSLKIRVLRTQGVTFAAAFMRKDQLELLRGLVKD